MKRILILASQLDVRIHSWHTEGNPRQVEVISNGTTVPVSVVDLYSEPKVIQSLNCKGEDTAVVFVLLGVPVSAIQQERS